MIGKIVAFKPRSKGGGNQLAYLAGEASEAVFTDYHSKDALGVWALGSGLWALGLSADGGFDAKATSRLAEGFHAVTGERLSRNSGADHRQGWDITMDDPKDFSLIHAFGTGDQKRDYYAARQEAWKVVVSEIERLVRPKYAGHEGPVKIAMQIFEHDDSRSGDPHKHGHGFLFNVGVLSCGKTCAIDVGPVMRSKAYLGQLYQSELARQYALKGRAVAFEERESTDTRTKTRYAVATIPDLATSEQMAGFSERAADIANALDAKGVNKSVKAKNAAALATRDEKKFTRAQMRELWDEKAKALGLDFEAFHAALDKAALPPEDRIIVERRVLDEFVLLSKSAIDGNGILGEHDIAFAAARAMRGQTLERIREVVDTFERKLVPIQEDNGFGRQFTTNECIKLERAMVAQFKELAAAQPLEPIGIEACARAESEWEAKTGHKLTDEQRAAARHIVSGPGMLSNIEGEAGTGKSTLMEVAAAAWKASGLRVIGAAPTGKAAEALAMSLGEADTCARLLLDIANGRQKLDDKTVLVIDECGMLASPTYAKLVGHAKKAGAKLVCVGDRSQLAAIGMRGGFQAAIDAAGMASITENRRQMNALAVGGYIGKLFREGKAAEALDLIDKEGRLTTAANPEDIIASLAERWIKDDSAPLGKMVLAELVETVGELNDAIRCARKDAGQLGEEFEAELTTKDGAAFRQELAVGEKILFLQNAGKQAGMVNIETNRPASPKNGTAALIEDIRQAREGSLQITARTEDGRLLRWETADYSTFALGYAHSYHKSQGSTATNVYAVAEGSQVADLGLAYVGATRHKNDCHMFVSQDARQRWAQRASIRADARMVSEKLQIPQPQTPEPNVATVPTAEPVATPVAERPVAAQPQAAEPIVVNGLILDLSALLNARRNAEEKNSKSGRSGKSGSASTSRTRGLAYELVDGGRLTMDLGKAATRGDLTGIAEQIALGADIDAELGGMRAIHRAANNSRPEAVKFLIAEGADLEVRNGRGLTPLHMAAMRGDNAVVLALVSGCADIAALENRQRKPADLAEGAGHAQLAAALRQIEAEIIRTRTIAATTLPTPRPTAKPIPKPRTPWAQELGPAR